jgi:hypothetical protein
LHHQIIKLPNQPHLTTCIFIKHENNQRTRYFLAQFLGDKPPFNDLKAICQWAKDLGYLGVQIPTGMPAALTCKKQQKAKPMQMN